MKKNNAFEFWVVVCIIVFSLILFGLYMVFDVYNKTKSYTIFMKPYTILECEKWDCENVSDKLVDYNNKPYTVFFDSNKMGVYDLYYNNVDDKYYVFDRNNENIYNGEKLFAFTGKASIEDKVLTESEVSSEELVKLQDVSDLKFNKTTVRKINQDFDGDAESESIYTINSEENVNTMYSVLVYRDGNKYHLLDKKISKDNTLVGFSYVNSIIDIFEDGKLEFIYTTAYFDNIGSCNVLYRLKGKKFVSVNECEIVR